MYRSCFLNSVENVPVSHNFHALYKSFYLSIPLFQRPTILTEEYKRHRYVGLNCVDVCYLLLVPKNFFNVYRHPQFVFSLPFSGAHLCFLFHSAGHICVFSSIQRGTSVFSLPFSGAHLCSVFHSAGHICVPSSIQRGTSVFFLPFSGAHLCSLFHSAGHKVSGKIKNLRVNYLSVYFNVRLCMGQGK